MPMCSEWGEDHEHLVAGVVGCEPEGPGPATDLTPSEPSVEVLQPFASPGSEMQLFQPQLISGDLPEFVGEGGADASSAPVGVCLEVVNGAPVPDEPVGVAVEDDPSGEDAASLGNEEATLLRVESADDLVRDRLDVVIADRWKGESGGAARVGDSDPAVDQLSPEFGGDVVRVGDLDKVEGGFVRHDSEHVRGV